MNFRLLASASALALMMVAPQIANAETYGDGKTPSYPTTSKKDPHYAPPRKDPGHGKHTKVSLDLKVIGNAIADDEATAIVAKGHNVIADDGSAASHMGDVANRGGMIASTEYGDAVAGKGNILDSYNVNQTSTTTLTATNSGIHIDTYGGYANGGWTSGGYAYNGQYVYQDSDADGGKSMADSGKANGGDGGKQASLEANLAVPIAVAVNIDDAHTGGKHGYGKGGYGKGGYGKDGKGDRDHVSARAQSGKQGGDNTGTAGDGGWAKSFAQSGRGGDAKSSNKADQTGKAWAGGGGDANGGNASARFATGSLHGLSVDGSRGIFGIAMSSGVAVNQLSGVSFNANASFR